LSLQPQRRLKRPRIFYGWYIVALTGASGVFAGGTSQAFLGLFVIPIQDETGWSRAAIAGAITLATFAGGGISPFVGRLADKSGPRVLMATGVLIYGLAYLSMTQVSQLWHFYIAYFVARTASLNLMGGVVGRTAAVNWFYRKRGRVMGLQNTAVPLGGALFAAIAGALLAVGMNWRDVFSIFGGAAIVVLLVPVAVFMRKQPEDLGLLPDGDEIPPATREETASKPAPAPRTEQMWTVRQAMRTRAIWMIASGTLLQSLASGGVSFHLPSYYADAGLPPSVVAASASIFLFSGAFSATAWGLLTERFSERILVVTATAAAAVMTVFARFINDSVSAFVFAVMYGATTRGEGALVMMLLAAYYGRRSFGAISGLVTTFSLVGLGLGPFIFARMFDVRASYDLVFTTSTVILAVSAALFWLVRPPRPRIFEEAQDGDSGSNQHAEAAGGG
jgi:MFS family permease